MREVTSLDQTSSAINGCECLFVEALVNILLGFRHRWFHQTGDLAQLDYRLDAFHVDLAARCKTESWAQAFIIHSFGSGFVGAIFGEEDSDNFFFVLRIRYPISGPNHGADETHEQVLI